MPLRGMNDRGSEEPEVQNEMERSREASISSGLRKNETLIHIPRCRYVCD
jgi:hypothetical protein